MKLYKKVMKMANILFYFSMQDWRFSDDNVRQMWRSLSPSDRVVFPFSMAEMSWDYMTETFLLGQWLKTRIYVEQQETVDWLSDYIENSGNFYNYHFRDSSLSS